MKVIKRMHKIAHKLTVSVVLAITCIFLLTTIYEYQKSMSDMEDNLSFKLEYTADMMSASLADPVWDYDYSGVEAFGDSLFKDPEIALLMVLDDVSGELYSHEMLGTGYELADRLAINHPIVYEGKSIGTLTIGITKYFSREEIENQLLLRSLELLVSIITLTVIIFFISSKITKPLAILEDDAKRLAQGKERIVMSSYGDDEIGSLAKTFNDMGDIVEAMTSQLYEINDSLEDKVAHRTAELLEKNNELNNAMKTLKETQNELIRSSKLKLTTRLVAGVAQEINTPLGLTITITTFIEEKVKQIHKLLAIDDLTKEDIKKLTEDILEASSSLESNLRRVTKLMQHFKELMLENQNQSPVWFEFDKHIKKVTQGLMMDLMGSNIEIKVSCPENLIIKSYPNAYLQILKQLADNAVLHGFKEGNGGNISIDCEERESSLVITFKDDGEGMTSEVAENIFSPFYKGDMKMDSSGLGLAIVDNIVNVQLGGFIRCSSNEREGTKFEIKVPVEKQ